MVRFVKQPCLAFPVFEEVVRHFIETGERTATVEYEDA